MTGEARKSKEEITGNGKPNYVYRVVYPDDESRTDERK